MKQIFIKYMPGSLYTFLKKARYFYFERIKGFHHKVAQEAELKSAVNFMTSRNEYMELIRDVEAFKDREAYEKIVHRTPYINDFFRTIEEYRTFARSVRDACCLEIGSGPIGALVLMPWIKERIIIEPLLDLYKKTQLELFGKTFFTNDVRVYSQNAEVFISELENSIDGFIVSRNVLDHCANPWKILENISRYARSGCKLLLWTDLWHLYDIDNQHKNIIKDKNAFEKTLIDLGFNINTVFSDVRPDESTIEYGCIATKTRTSY